MIAGCSTVNEGGGTAAALRPRPRRSSTTPTRVKGYQTVIQKDHPDSEPADARDATRENRAAERQSGESASSRSVRHVIVRLYKLATWADLQQAIGRSAVRPALSASSSSDVTYKRASRTLTEYVLESKIRRCWVKKARGANANMVRPAERSRMLRSTFSISQAAVQSPLLDRSTNKHLLRPSGRLLRPSAPRMTAGIYDERAGLVGRTDALVRGYFQRQDLRNLMLEDDIKRTRRAVPSAVFENRYVE